MKDYKGFIQEAVSSARLMQIAAKGKGASAAQKMAADGLKAYKNRSPQASGGQKALPGATKGGAMVKTNTSGGALAVKKGKDGNSGGDLVKTGNKKENQRDFTGFKRTGVSDKGYMTSPDTTTNKRDEPKTSKFTKKVMKKTKKLGKKLVKDLKNNLTSQSGNVGMTSDGNSSDPSVRYQ